MSVRSSIKPVSQQTIVVTGATSGIGLATARRAARAGACVFMIARGAEDLKALCEELQGQGARVAYAVADVADHAALEEAAAKCLRLFGGFDTWINNAGVSIFGPIRETTLEDQRRLFETNYWGVVNGSLVAVEHMRTAPGGGTVINVGSILSDAPLPVQGVYSASKHAVKGFTNALRMELIRDKAPVRVSLVKPAAVDSPYRRHARNLTGYAVQNPQPVYATHVVADAILHCAAHPIREITVGGGGRLIASFYAALPGVAEPILAWFAPSLRRDRTSAYQPYEDGLYDPTEDGLNEEVHYPMVRQFSVLAEARKHPGVTLGTLALIGVVATATILLAQRSGPTRWQRMRRSADPRNWGARGRAEALGERLRHEAEHLGGRARSGADDLMGRLSDLWPGEPIEAGRAKAGRYARQAGGFARSHAREGGSLLALAAIAAAVAAAAVDANRSGPDRTER